MPRLRIGVNALYLIPGQVGGTEIYLRHLLTALAELSSGDEFVVFLNREALPDLVPRAANFRAVPSLVRASIRPARILWEQGVLPVLVARHAIDVLLNPGFTAPVLARCPMVTVFHDLQHKRHPEYFRWFDLPFWRLLLWSSARRSRLILADSEATGRDLKVYYRLPEARIRVVPLGVDPAFFKIGRGTCPLDPYLLVVSTLHPHKNLERLIRCFAQFRALRPEYRLVVAGLRGFHTQPLERLRSELGLEEWVRFTGWLPREELYQLYSGATAFLYPSTFEGFGLPVVEAMAAGIPVGCSAIEPLITNAGGAALLFDPDDGEAIVRAMLRLVSDVPLRARLAEEGPRQAAGFSWEKTAARTLEALREVASGRRPSTPIEEAG